MTGRPDFSIVKGAALPRLPALLSDWLPGGHVQGREYVCAGLSGGAGRSFSVNLDSGAWADFAADDRGGDPVSLFAAVNGLGQAEACHRLAEVLGMGCNGSQASRERPRRDDGALVMPAPDDAPEPPASHYQHGKPSASWRYLDAAGRLLFMVCRFDPSDGRKIVQPLTLWREPPDRLTWRWKHPFEPRPLYGLDRLASAPADTSVLVAEGEKAADAAPDSSRARPWP